MRLIDSDALLERIKKDPLFPLVEEYGISGVIKAEPTVEINEAMIIEYCRKKHLVIMTAEVFADLFMNRRIEYEFKRRAK